MGLLWKDVLWVGRWTWPDGRELKIGPNDVWNAFAQGTRMRQSRLDAPWVWEHQPGAEPRPVEMSAVIYGDPAKRAKWAQGFINPAAGYRVRNDKRRGPVLEAAIDTTRLTADEVERIKRVGKVSCRIDRDFRDARGDGVVYPGYVVSHIAVTPKPLEPDQGPFEMSVGSAAETFYLGGAAMADEKSDKGEESSDASGSFKALLEALREKGWMIPDEVTDIGGLIIAVKANGQAPDDLDDPLDADIPATTPADTGSPAPMMMSQAEMSAKYPARVRNDREELLAKVKLIRRKGKVAPHVADQLARELDAFELSYAADGTLAADLSPTLPARIAAYERLPDGMVMRAGGVNRQTVPVPPPPEFVPPDPEKERQDRVKAAKEEMLSLAAKH